MLELEISEDDIARFAEDGFLIRDRIIDDAMVDRLRAAMDDCFEGRFETGLMPDEVNWGPGSPAHVTRQICNGWKADRRFAAIVLDPAIGHALALVNGWPGTRIAHDNILWKPELRDGQPGGTLGMHQDSAYAVWAEPGLMSTVWIALDDVTAEGGTMVFARGSHLWERRPPIAQFHNPADWQAEFRAAAEATGTEPEIVPVAVPAGGGSIHHGWLWHGSGPNRSGRPRRSVVSHCFSSESRFTDQVGYVYSRYKRVGSHEMDESHFPILWHRDGYRSGFLGPYLARETAWHAGAPTLEPVA